MVGVVAEAPGAVVQSVRGVRGVEPAAQNRPGAVGAVLLEACVPANTFGTGRQVRVPAQIRRMDGDRYFVGEGDLGELS